MALYPPIDTSNFGWLERPGGHSIYFEVSGNPEGIPVLFIHGGPGGRSSPKCRRFFNPHKYRIVLFDQRGCGNSRPKASISCNQTDYLLDDIEAIRVHLDIDAWGLFGGSWGSFLAIVYGQRHPNRVLWMVLRGLFTVQESEIDWMYKFGANQLFPDAWEKVLELLPESKRQHVLYSYYEILKNDNSESAFEYARRWTTWEYSINRVKPAEKEDQREDLDNLAFARIETHYFVNRGFIDSKKFFDDMAALSSIPICIVQGRFDLVCPFITAWCFAKRLPNAELIEVREGGHSAYDNQVEEALVKIMDEHI